MATGSTDTSVKLIDVEKMKYYGQKDADTGEAEAGVARPITRSFYDHIQV